MPATARPRRRGPLRERARRPADRHWSRGLRVTVALSTRRARLSGWSKPASLDALCWAPPRGRRSGVSGERAALDNEQSSHLLAGRGAGPAQPRAVRLQVRGCSAFRSRRRNRRRSGTSRRPCSSNPVRRPSRRRCASRRLTPGFALLDENFVSRGFGLHHPQRAGRSRSPLDVARGERPANALLPRRSSTGIESRIAEDTTPPFPQQPLLDEPSRIAMEGLIAEVRRQSADVASFTTELLRHINQAENDPYVSLFLERGSTPSERAQLATIIPRRRADPGAHRARRSSCAIEPGPVQSEVAGSARRRAMAVLQSADARAGPAAGFPDLVARRRAHRRDRGRFESRSDAGGSAEPARFDAGGRAARRDAAARTPWTSPCSRCRSRRRPSTACW